jgi:hypothetical protein
MTKYCRLSITEVNLSELESVYNLYGNAIIDELEAQGFHIIVVASRSLGIEPSVGYTEWVDASIAATFAKCMISGKTPVSCFPKRVASSIIEVALEMILAGLRTGGASHREDNNNKTIH